MNKKIIALIIVILIIVVAVAAVFLIGKESDPLADYTPEVGDRMEYEVALSGTVFGMSINYNDSISYEVTAVYDDGSYDCKLDYEAEGLIGSFMGKNANKTIKLLPGEHLNPYEDLDEEYDDSDLKFVGKETIKAAGKNIAVNNYRLETTDEGANLTGNLYFGVDSDFLYKMVVEVETPEDNNKAKLSITLTECNFI